MDQTADFAVLVKEESCKFVEDLFEAVAGLKFEEVAVAVVRYAEEVHVGDVAEAVLAAVDLENDSAAVAVGNLFAE